jgi:mannitol/fructose-specific phosphotransferase system IIA component (Ntr-type)
MHLTDLLTPRRIVLGLEADDKADAIRQLVELLERTGAVTDPRRACRAVLRREQTRTTGIGGGLAVPHGKTDAAPELAAAVGVADEPIDFGSIDGEPVTLIVLLVSPADQTGPHIHALARISRLLSREPLRRAIRSAESPEQVVALFAEHEQAVDV